MIEEYVEISRDQIVDETLNQTIVTTSDEKSKKYARGALSNLIGLGVVELIKRASNEGEDYFLEQLSIYAKHLKSMGYLEQAKYVQEREEQLKKPLNERIIIY